MEIIPPPPDLKKPFNWKIPLVLGIILVVATGITIPLILLNTNQNVEAGFIFRGMNLEEYHNESEIVTFRFDFRYENEFSVTIQLRSILLSIQMKQKESIEWQSLFGLYTKLDLPVPIEQGRDFSGYFNVSNSESDTAKRLLLGELIKKEDFHIRIRGNCSIIPMEQVEEDFPSSLSIDLIKSAREVFGYEVPSTGPSIVKLVDLITPGIDPLQPTLFHLITIVNYRNNLLFPIFFQSIQFTILNRTEQATLGMLTLDASYLGNIGANQSKNFSVDLKFDPNQLGWIVSDLLSGYSDVIKVVDISGSVKIGEVVIDFEEKKQAITSDLKFALNIVRYYPNEMMKLVLDIELVNPANITFHISHLNLKLTIANTQTLVAMIEKDLNVTVLPYSHTRVNNLTVDANYQTFLTHIIGNFDLMGYINAESFNFIGTITYAAYNKKIV